MLPGVFSFLAPAHSILITTISAESAAADD